MDPEHMKALVLEKHRDQIRRDVRRGGLAAILGNSTTTRSKTIGTRTLTIATDVASVKEVDMSSWIAGLWPATQH
jgi:hypothetical protein